MTSRRQAGFAFSWLLSGLVGAAVAAEPGATQPVHPYDPAAARLSAPDEPEEAWEPDVPEHVETCVDGSAGGFPCHRVDLLELIPLATIGGGSGSDMWGWTDPDDGREYALLGRSTGTSFLDVTDPENPVYLGNLPSHVGTSSWRDIKTYANHAYIVADHIGDHGMQVFDLTQLRSVLAPPVTFGETAHYPEFGSAHNIVVNEDTGYAYAVGISSGTTPCSGGLHMIDLSAPASPTFAGCFSTDGYTHDAQCVLYVGPDPDHAGSEVCLSSNEDTLTIVDVTDKSNPVQLSRVGYTGSGYTHQGWLTEDHRYFLLDDELDESGAGHNTRTYVWDVVDLDQPVVIGVYEGPTTSTDHNLYVREGFAYEANYRSGLRIVGLQDVASGILSEVAYFDTYPPSDAVGTGNGAWTAYPFLPSGNVLVSTLAGGMFILRPVLCSTPSPPTNLSAVAAGDSTIQVTWDPILEPGVTYDLYRALGTCPGGNFELVASGLASPSYLDIGVSGSVDYAYVVQSSVEGGLCRSQLSDCDSAQTTGPCTAPPLFDGLETVANQAAETCALDLGWSAATPSCGAAVTYAVYRSTISGFEPGVGNRLAAGLVGETFTDELAASGVDYVYVTRATDDGSGTEDTNRVEIPGRATGPIVDGPWASGVELGDPGFSYGSGLRVPEHIGWEIVTDRQHTGDRSLFSTYNDDQCTWVSTPPLSLTPGEASELSFWTVYDIEPRWDGGVVQTSVDGGASWLTLPLDGGYPDTFRSSSDACGFSENDPAFTGTDLAWTQFTADLSGFAGQQVQIRWIFSTDGAVTEEGWYVDDVSITHVAVPGDCGIGLFADGFESGDTQGWSSTTP